MRPGRLPRFSRASAGHQVPGAALARTATNHVDVAVSVEHAGVEQVVLRIALRAARFSARSWS
jgi:hypothetical protein